MAGLLAMLLQLAGYLGFQVGDTDGAQQLLHTEPAARSCFDGSPSADSHSFPEQRRQLL